MFIHRKDAVFKSIKFAKVCPSYCGPGTSKGLLLQREISHVLDDIPTFRTAVLVSVLLGVQRQFPEICVGVPDPVSVIGEGRRSADRDRRRDFYRPLCLSLGLGRRTRR